MELVQRTPDLSAYLAAGEAVDHEHPRVREGVAHLSERHPGAYAYSEAAYAFVRDTIPHSHDAGDPRVTWRASFGSGWRGPSARSSMKWTIRCSTLNRIRWSCAP